MSSGLKYNLKKEKAVSTIVVSERILMMRMKIEDSSYVNNAVNLIASVLSKQLVEQPKMY